MFTGSIILIQGELESRKIFYHFDTRLTGIFYHFDRAKKSDIFFKSTHHAPQALFSAVARFHALFDLLSDKTDTVCSMCMQGMYMLCVCVWS